MRKRAHPEVQLGTAAFTIGLGPNFRAGVTTDLVIETAWGPSLGAVIESGDSLPLSGEPQAIGGAARERYVYAPVAGVFTTALDIGTPVQAGDEVARIGGTIIRAPLTGWLRGITHRDVPVTVGTKIVEVDPRMEGAQIAGIGKRPATIAEGVLRAIASRL